MIKINIIAVGGLKENYFKEAEAEYLKRLSAFATVQIFECKERSEKTGEEKLRLEAEEILEKIKKNIGTILVLDINAKQVSSTDLAENIKRTVAKVSTINFVIGGSDGLSDLVKNVANYSFSFGKITLPHQLCRIVLQEQIYRAFCILAGKKYHK